MSDLRFTVKINGDVIAEHMELQYAVILLEGIFRRYFEESKRGMEVTIASEPLDREA